MRFNLFLLFALLILILAYHNDLTYAVDRSDRKDLRKYELAFQGAVDDTAAMLAKLEEHQLREGVQYNTGKDLVLDREVLSRFYENLAHRFGVEGLLSEIQSLVSHVPAAVIIRYDGYNMVRVRYDSGFFPEILPVRPYTYILPGGSPFYFTLGEDVSLYDAPSNTFLSGTYDEVRALANISPLNDRGVFERERSRTITSSIEKDLSVIASRYLEDVSYAPTVEFYVPAALLETGVTDVGFATFIQGYPLPGGQRLDSYALGFGSVVTKEALVGVITFEGYHRAYPESCIPDGLVEIERIYDELEAAKKGYFIMDCQP